LGSPAFSETKKPLKRLQTGRFSNKLLAHINKELSLNINNLLRRLKNDRKAVRIDNILYGQEEERSLNIQGSLIEMHEEDYLLISFTFTKIEKTATPVTINMSLESQERIKQLELELQLAREGLQTTIEELETSNEELQSVNEELYTVNNEYAIDPRQ